ATIDLTTLMSAASSKPGLRTVRTGAFLVGGPRSCPTLKDYCLFGTHRGGQKGAIILADLFGHQLVEQGIHPQDRVFVFVALQSEVTQLVGILAEIEKLDVVVLEDLIERLRRVERVGGVGTCGLGESIDKQGKTAGLPRV